MKKSYWEKFAQASLEYYIFSEDISGDIIFIEKLLCFQANLSIKKETSAEMEFISRLDEKNGF